MKKFNTSKKLCALIMVVALVIGSIPATAFVHAAEVSVAIEANGPRLNAKVEGTNAVSYQWQIADTADGNYSNITGANGAYYDITAADEGKFIRVVAGDKESEPTDAIGQLVTFDIGMGAISLGATYSGKDANGVAVTGTHQASNIYLIQHNDNETFTKNNVAFSGNLPDKPFDVTLDGVNMGDDVVNHTQSPGSSGVNTPTGGMIAIKATNTDTKHVTIRLKGENVVRHINYYNGGDTNTPQTINSSLTFTDINGDGEASGSLYVPVKLEADEIDDFVKTKDNYNHWNAGIGGYDANSLVQNLTIAGGKIQVVTTLGDNCTAIGAGGNGYCQMKISGGEVIAHCNGTGAAIGGGIGWNAAGGRANVLISGGKIYAKNHAEIQSGDETVGGVAIGSGSSFVAKGTEGQVTITGGTVEAYGTFGNGIGGGNSSSSIGGNATINISGGTVTATSIGGGNSKSGAGGDATVSISNNANVTLLKGIGGGDSQSGNGGAANITVTNGIMNCAGVIGGGNGSGDGDGGTAAINVSGGILTAQSVGGGTGGINGNGGAAEIEISGGTIETGSIGGGSTLNTTDGKLGYAKAVISGGDIKGQFLMAGGGTEACTFTMTGGTLHGVNTFDTSKYNYVQRNGAAVFMDDENGVVSMSGGTIKDCSAEYGGAVYMTAGTFNLSGTGRIENCHASADGGAVYLGGGIANITGGAIENNTAAGSGGGAFVNGGNVNVKGGSIKSNSAVKNGGAIAVNNGSYRMTGGAVDENTAVNGSGGGIYVASEGRDVSVDILSGSVSGNNSKVSGGAVAVYGRQNGQETINVTVGINQEHFGADNKPINCNHGDEGIYDCPVMNSNHTTGSGGAVYVTGNEATRLNLYCCEESDDELLRNKADGEDGQSNFMKVDGGKVLICASQEQDENQQDAKHGNVQIHSTVYVKGGQVDLWGDMMNPRFEDIITVDITPGGNDYFKDHRAENKFYRLIYFENFTDPVTGTKTGQYKELEVAMNGWVTIASTIYSHPGYTIQGWNTDPEGNDQNTPEDSKGWYKVNEKYLFDGNPIGNLTIYAIWEANGYTVKFDPNVEPDENYTGEMSNQIMYYDLPTELQLNNYGRTGYNFTGWNTVADGSGDRYADGATVQNLTSELGTIVTLYAQWELCDHSYDTHTYTYNVINNGAALERVCSCGDYSETAVLSAADTVYDQQQHPAEVKYSCDGWTPEVVYTDSNGTELTDGLPVNAGTYTASVSGGGKTASVTYTIEKAEQPAPGKPEYDSEITDAKSLLKVKPVEPSPIGDPNRTDVYDPTYTSVPEYQIVYYIGDTKYETEWKRDDQPGDTYAVEFELNVALTNYYVYARYSECGNYKASEATSADKVYFFAGNVEIKVVEGTGIMSHVEKASQDTNGNVQGVTVYVSAEDGYYIPSGFGTDITTEDSNGGSLYPQATIAAVTKYSEYKVEGIPTNSCIIITLDDARKIPLISGSVTHGETFDQISGSSSIAISRDSAYTAGFKVDDYDAEFYKVPIIYFNSQLPDKTTVIMKDLSTGKYYSYTASGNTASISLDSFVLMGSGDTNYTLQSGDLNLLFAVDLSDTLNGAEANISNTLSLKPDQSRDTDGRTPELSGSVTTEAKPENEFALTANTSGLNGTVTYECIEFARASKWNDRHGALIITPDPDTPLPEDAYLKYNDGVYNVNTYLNPAGYFIIPLGAVGNGNVHITLVSNMFTPNATYKMDVRWIVAESISGSAPVNGELVAPADSNAQAVELNFFAGKLNVPSIRIDSYGETADDRLYCSDEQLKPKLTWVGIPVGNEVTLSLLKKDDSGQFAGTGWSYKVTLDEYNSLDGIGSDSIEIAPIYLQEFADGTYCLHATVMEGLVKVNEAKYYFICCK